MSDLNQKNCVLCGNVVGRWPTCQTCGFVNRMFTREKGPEVDAYLREVAVAKGRWESQRAKDRELEEMKREIAGLRAMLNQQQCAPPPRPKAVGKSVEPEPGEEMTLMLPGDVPLVFCWCPATTSEAWKRISGGEDFFWMGSPEGEVGRSSDETLHQVKLTRGFWMGKYPVTQRQWKSVAKENPSFFRNSGLDAPVENVSYVDVQKWIAKVDVKIGGEGLDLPTEAQWEYGCRAGSREAIYTGKSLTSAHGFCANLTRVGWYKEVSEDRTHRVGELLGNGWGLYDMHGNVLEWCQDFFGDCNEELVVDPKGAGSGSYCVCRGGSWFFSAKCSRSACRSKDNPVNRWNRLGFRLVRT